MGNFLKSIIGPTHRRTLTFVILLLVIVAIPLTVLISQERQDIRQRASPLNSPLNLSTLSSIKIFGQDTTTETSRNIVNANKIFHGAGVIVDKNSNPNKAYVADTGNNRILGFNGVGYCSIDTSQSCTTNQDCESGDVCNVDGSKPADIVFGQPDMQSAACNRDNNLGIFKAPTSETLCSTQYPVNLNISEQWQRINMDVDSESNLYVPDTYNDRILKYNSPFSLDKTNGKGDAIADFVWGQNDFYHNGINKDVPLSSSIPPSSSSLRLSFSQYLGASTGVSVDPQGNVWIADRFNNRVLRFSPNEKEANLVLGKRDFTSADLSNCFTNNKDNLPPLNQLCIPTLARINPETGELYVTDEYEGPFMVRILVFKPPFVNGMSASKVIIPNLPGPVLDIWGGKYRFQSTGFVFNPYKIGDYASGVIWINEHQANRTLLLDSNGNVVKIMGAKDTSSRGGDTQYNGSCGNIYDPSRYYLWWPGGSIGFDSENNIYLADENFSTVSRYALPYTLRQVNNQPCLPLPNGGIFNKTIFHGFNTEANVKLGEATGVLTHDNQLIIRDEGSRLKIWNNYLSKPQFSSQPDIVIKGDFRSGPENIIAQAVDDQNRLWIRKNSGQLMVYKLPFTGNDLPIKDNIRLYWSDTDDEIDNDGASVAFDKVNLALYINDLKNHRVLRIKNYNVLFDTNPANDKLLVDMALGQPDKTTVKCNNNEDNNLGLFPSDHTFCLPHEIKFDKLGNLYVTENSSECHGNDRITVFLASDLQNAKELFPNLKAKRVFVGSMTQRGPCGYSAIDYPGSPLSIAFDSKNHMVLGTDGYYGYLETRSTHVLWYYADPINKQTPDMYINFPMGATGELTFDNQDNLIIQDGTWYRVSLVNLNSDPSLLTPLPNQIISTYATPTYYTPVIYPTPTLTPVPTLPGSGSACSCVNPNCSNGICQCGGFCLGGQHCEYPQENPSSAKCVAEPTNTPAPKPTLEQLITLDIDFALKGILGPNTPLHKFEITGQSGQIISYIKTVEIADNKIVSRIKIDDSPGAYKLIIQPSGYLPKKHTFTVNKSGDFLVPPLPLSDNEFVVGNVNNDNTIDVLDYGGIIDCFGPKITSEACTRRKNDSQAPDLNNDGVVDGIDYNVFLRNFGKSAN